MEVFDMFGERIFPGNVIMFAGSGLLKPAIVSHFDVSSRHYWDTASYGYIQKNKFRIYYFGLGKTVHTHRTETSVHKKETIYLCTRSIEMSDDNPDSARNRIFLLKEPSFYCDNPLIAKLLTVADYAIDEGKLPRGYELGNSIVKKSED